MFFFWKALGSLLNWVMSWNVHVNSSYMTPLSFQQVDFPKNVIVFKTMSCYSQLFYAFSLWIFTENTSSLQFHSVQDLYVHSIYIVWAKSDIF